MYNNFSGNMVLVMGIPIQGFSKQNPIRFERTGRDSGILKLILLQTSPWNTLLTTLTSGVNYEVIEGCSGQQTMRCTQTGITPIRFPVAIALDGRQDLLNFQNCAVDGTPRVYTIGEEVNENEWDIICTGLDAFPLGALL